MQEFPQMQVSDVMTSIQTSDITQSHDRACDGMWTYAHLQDIYIDKQEDDRRDQSIEDSEM